MLHPLQAGLRLVSTRPAFCDKRKGEEEEYGWDFVKTGLRPEHYPDFCEWEVRAADWAELTGS